MYKITIKLNTVYAKKNLVIIILENWKSGFEVKK
jgi:hypothetical protein